MPFRKYECVICGYIYDEELGDPEDGLAPGTRWEDIPDEWVCPDCGVSKFDFELMKSSEISIYYLLIFAASIDSGSLSSACCKVLSKFSNWSV